MFAKQESRSWRPSWRRHRGGKKSMIKSRYWLRLHWPNIALDEEHSAQISKNLGQFLHLWKFWPKKQTFLLYASCHLTRAFARGLLLMKTHHFWIFQGKICMPTNGQEILTGFGLPKRSKTPQKWPFCPFFDTQEAVLGELSFGGAKAKFKNSTCVGKYTGRTFQQAHLEKIWTPGRPPKSAANRRDA